MFSNKPRRQKAREQESCEKPRPVKKNTAKHLEIYVKVQNSFKDRGLSSVGTDIFNSLLVGEQEKA